MLLAIDVGNTHILAGCFAGDELVHECRLKTDAFRTVDEYSALLMSVWREHFGNRVEFSRVVLSSVVPPLTQTVTRICQTRFGLTPLIVGPGMKTGLKIKTQDPAAVGADRVVNAVAAKSLYGVGAIVIDFGTATSFDVIDTHSQYLGGIIAPGIDISLDALVSRTAKLPRITLTWPGSVVGNSTVSAMQSGCLVGYVCMVEGLVARIHAEVPGIKTVIATGGFSDVIAAHTQCISECDRMLTLKGMKILAELNL